MFHVKHPEMRVMVQIGSHRARVFHVKHSGQLGQSPSSTEKRILAGSIDEIPAWCCCFTRTRECFT